MELLTTNGLMETMLRCNEYQNYKAIIVCKNQSDVIAVAETIFDFHRSTPLPGVKKVLVRRAGRCGVDFTSGSRIDIMSVRHVISGGVRCNEVIYESNVDIENDEVCVMLRRTLTPYRCGEFDCTQTEPADTYDAMASSCYQDAASSEALDDFLSSFIVL